MGNLSGVAPDFKKMSVSIMPGWTLHANIFGFSAARNSSVLICASFEVKYPESPTTCFVGKAIAPAVFPNTTARLALAVGKNAFAAMMIDLTFV